MISYAAEYPCSIQLNHDLIVHLILSDNSRDLDHLAVDSLQC